MRFSNLTITLTLTCLSIVAIVALLLLPITDGLCKWTGNNSSKSFYTNSYDSDGKGWHLSASLSASGSGASVSVSPSVYGVRAHTEATKYSGTANVRAKRHSGIKLDYYYCDYYCPDCNSGFGHTNPIPVEEFVDQNTDPGEEQTIVAEVKQVKFYNITGEATTVVDGQTQTITGTAEVSVADYAAAGYSGSYTWQHSSGVELMEKSKTVYDEMVEWPAQSQSADTGTSYPTVDSEAETSFSFQTASDSGSVYYDADAGP